MEPLRMLPLVLASLFTVMAAVDAMIAFQPTLLVPLRDSWQRWVGTGWVPPSFASLFATGIAVAGIAIAAAVLSTFIRGVQSAPFVWLGPVVVGAGASIIYGMRVSLPMPLSTAWFAGLSALLCLGGGALLQPGALVRRIAGVIVLAIPISLLAIGYAQAPALLTVHGVPQLGLVLLMTTVATAALAVLTRSARTADSDAVGEQLIELLERAKAGEERAAYAEQQLAHAGASAGFGGQTTLPIASDDELALLRGRGSKNVALWAALLFLASSLITAYFAGYAPLQRRVVAQRAQLDEQAGRQAKALASLRASFDEERRGLEAQLAAAKTAREEAPAQIASPTAPAQAPEARAATVKPESANGGSKPIEAAAPVEPAKAAAPAKAQATAHARVSRHGLPRKKLHSAPARATTTKAAPAGAPAPRAAPQQEEEPINDDPIGGL